MKRILTLLVLLVTVTASTPAAAHTLSLVGAVSVNAGELTIRVMDVYGAAPPIERVTAVAAMPGKAPGGKRVLLQETAPGVYSGTVPTAGGELFDFEIDVIVMEELYRTRLKNVAAGESRPEALQSMAAVEPLTFSWGPILYGVAVVVIVTATVVALLKKRQATEDDEGEEQT